MASLIRLVWLLPLVSALVWLAMLLALLLHWVLSGQPHYPSMKHKQTIAYISNVGAADYKPLFIAMGTTSVVIFDLGFIAERWLRHSGELLQNTSTGQKVLSGLAIACSIIGAAGLILLTIFDTWRHHSLHDVFLTVFIGGYVFCAIFTCAQYHRLGAHFRQFRILRVSFWMKFAFIIVEVLLAVAFGVLNRTRRWNEAAIIEWVIALIYSVWIVSFIIDFLPSATPNHHRASGSNMLEESVLANPDVANDDQADRYGRALGSENGARYPSGTSGPGGMTNGSNHSNEKEEGPRGII